jgi:hypothetical protein
VNLALARGADERQTDESVPPVQASAGLGEIADEQMAPGDTTPSRETGSAVP